MKTSIQMGVVRRNPDHCCGATFPGCAPAISRHIPTYTVQGSCLSVGVVHPVHEQVTQILPARTYQTSSTVYLRPECGCSYG
jgi:hypothetical protein